MLKAVLRCLKVSEGVSRLVEFPKHVLRPLKVASNVCDIWRRLRVFESEDVLRCVEI